MPFPTRLVNVTDLLIERPDRSTGYGGDEVSRTTVYRNLCAIVERRSDVIRTPEGEEITLRADVRVEPDKVGIEEGDLLSWTDFDGTMTDEEAILVEPWGIGPTPSHIRVRVGAR